MSAPEQIDTGTDHLLAERRSGVLTLTLNRPEARNAQNLQIQLGRIAGADGKAVQLPRVLKAADVLQPRADALQRLLPVRAPDDEKAKLQQKVAELEQRVRQLEDELARQKARK